MDNEGHACSLRLGTAAELGAMRAWLAACIVGAITFTGTFYLLGGLTPAVTMPDSMQEAADSGETPAWPALLAAVPEASAAPEIVPASITEIVPAAMSAPSVKTEARIGDDPDDTKSIETKVADIQGHSGRNAGRGDQARR
jgi:hypothetical protein